MSRIVEELDELSELLFRQPNSDSVFAGYSQRMQRVLDICL